MLEESTIEPERLRRTTWFANQLAMKKVPLPLLNRNPPSMYSSLIESVEYLLLESHRKRKLILPELGAFKNRSLGIFSDYSGEGSGRYFVYSVLVCGFNMRESFNKRMAKVRPEFGLGAKEIAYKNLNKGQMCLALPDYLAAADQLPGFLCTVAIDKRIRSVFGVEQDVRRRLVAVLRDAELSVRKPDVAEKLLRVVHLAAYLTALLGRDGQNVFWMTDNDAICPTPLQHKQLLDFFFGRVLPLYQRPGSQFDRMGGATPFPERSVEMNDLLSLPDLAAGTLGDYLSKRDVLGPDKILVKEGTDKIMLWLGKPGIGLKKSCFFLRKGAGDSIERGVVEFSPVNPASGVFIPIYN
ncbi:MAG: hypothetical protein WBE45_02555 [Terriglobales bacterium]|jgi:hypothetical protein